MRRFLIAVAIAVTMVTGSGIAEASTVAVTPTVSSGFPARVTFRWYEAHRTWGWLAMPIGAPCWGLIVVKVGVTGPAGYRFCTDEMTWRNHPVGSVWNGYITSP